ncbi:MAG: hypothetical protein CMP10_16820 [Zetaproteobacteria bacterium]|nr:hypothetical protein [Pseudobdellovibrionaceae bacterium]
MKKSNFKLSLLLIVPLLSQCTLEFFFEDKKKNNLINEVRKVFGDHLKPLEPVYLPGILGFNPDAELLELGRNLFNDTLLSRNNDSSCATCHLSNHGFADGNSINVGTLGLGGPHGDNVGRGFGEGVLSTERGFGNDGMGFNSRFVSFRNSLSTVNAVFRMNTRKNTGLFHDGRFGDLRFQALLPIHTAEELCGQNPVPFPPHQENIFRPGGPLFKKPVTIRHAHSWDKVQGINLHHYNSITETVIGVPTRRPNGHISVPTRNECLAIAIAKIRMVPGYRTLFAKAFDTPEINDERVGLALAAFVMSHVSNRSPWDRFVAGDDSLTKEQLLGLAIYFTPIGKKITLGGHELTGAGCVSCHSGPTFGGKGFSSLGVRSNPLSSLSKPSFVNQVRTSGFVIAPDEQRGALPKCHLEDITVSGNYAPDIGFAVTSRKVEDCFKFRIPPLRNVIETWPYFHHGTAKGQGIAAADHRKRSLATLKQVIRYHLRGPISIELANQGNPLVSFFDETWQLDPYVPYYTQDFSGVSDFSSLKFPLVIPDDQVDWLADFVAFGLYDPEAVVTGSFGNPVGHPTSVPSGLTPTISRDHGTQLELPRHQNLSH